MEIESEASERKTKENVIYFYNWMVSLSDAFVWERRAAFLYKLCIGCGWENRKFLWFFIILFSIDAKY